MKCPNCGNEITGKFCTSCGTPAPVEESVKESVELIKKHPLIPRDIKVHGLIMDPESGKLEVITKDY